MQDGEAAPEQPVADAQYAQSTPGPRRRPVAIFVTVLVLLAIAAIALWALPRVLRPDPRALVRDLAEKYANAEHVHTQDVVEYSMSMGGMGQTMEMPITAWFSRPNLLFFENEGGLTNAKAVCDGKDLYMQIDALDGVIKLPAPAAFGDMPLEGVMPTPGGGMKSWVFPDRDSLPSDESVDASFSSIKYGLDESDEWLTSLEAPDNSWVLTLRSKGGPVVTLWIDKRSRTVSQVAAQIDRDTIDAAGSAGEEAMRRIPPEARAVMSGMQMRFVIKVNETQLDVAPPEGTYDYKPPEGMKVIEADTFQEGIEELVKDAMPQMPTFHMPSPPQTGE